AGGGGDRNASGAGDVCQGGHDRTALWKTFSVSGIVGSFSRAVNVRHRARGPALAARCRPCYYNCHGAWRTFSIQPGTRTCRRDIVSTCNKTVGKKNGILLHNRIVDDSNNCSKYTTAMTSSNSPDAIMTYAYDQVPSWAANGFIQPMDQFANKVGIKQADYFP